MTTSRSAAASAAAAVAAVATSHPRTCSCRPTLRRLRAARSTGTTGWILWILLTAAVILSGGWVIRRVRFSEI